MIKSKLDTNSITFHANAAHMEGLVTDLHEKIAKICEGGSERARKKHLDRGKLLPRERVERLLDPGTPFLELSQLAAYQCYDDDIPGAGLITGIGRVSGLSLIHISEPTRPERISYAVFCLKKKK